MKILYLHQYFNTSHMSGSTRSYEMARRLVAKGHQVLMVTSWREEVNYRYSFETWEEGIRVFWIPVQYSNHMVYKDRLKSFMLFALKAGKKAASLSADIVFASSTPLTIILPGAYAAKIQNVPLVFEVRDLWPELPIAVGALQNPIMQRAALYLEKFAYNRSERIVALSPGMKNGIIRRGYNETKISVIPNSADLEFFNPQYANKTSFRLEHPEIKNESLIIYTGTIGLINGVEYLTYIAAAALKHSFKLQFAIIGSGIEEPKVRSIAKKLGVFGCNFHMYPALPKCKIPDVLAAADVALSLFIDIKPMWNNSANKFFDALASGTPIAINYGGWQAELIEETGIGIVLPSNDAEESAIRLHKFVSDKILLQQAGKSARMVAEERFSRDNLADQLEYVLLSAVKRKY